MYRTPTSLLLLCAFAAACGHSEGTPPAATAAEGQDGRPAQDPRIRLVDTGQPPRRAVSFTYAEDQHESLEMVIGMALSQSRNDAPLPEVKLPAQRMTMDMRVTQVHADGSADLAFEITQVEALPAEGVPEPVRLAVEKAGATMEGSSGSYTVTPLGHVTQTRYDEREGADPQMQRMLQNLQQSMDQLSVPLPAEPIGAGAVWEVRDEVEMGELTWERAVVYRVLEVDERGLTLESRVTMGAPAQTFTPEGTDVQAELVFAQGQGTGQMRVVWDRLYAQVDSDIQVTIKLSFTVGEHQVSSSQEIDMDMAIRPLTRDGQQTEPASQGEPASDSASTSQAASSQAPSP